MVKSIDKYFVLIALVYAVVGMVLGNIMGATLDHSQMPTHAHIMLVGWASMGLSGLIYKSWPELKSGLLPVIHFWLLQVGCLIMCIGLYLMYGGIVPEPQMGPVLGISGIIVLGSLALFTFIFATKAKSS
ncbi:MAG: TonB-dependent receptor [Ponticaulis sp.]|nr:TonB-dependent receptor [Ponticaulis sp.]